MNKADNVKFRQNQNKFSWKRLLLVLVISIALGFIVFIAAGAYIYSITPQNNINSFYDSFKFIIKPGETAFKGKKVINILCLGLDHNYTTEGIMYTKSARTDTMFIISIDSEAKYLNMLSIPRDTWVDIPDYGYGKINSAYAIGGLKLAQKTVSNFLGISLDHYIIIRIKAGVEIVDALGGLNIDVPKDMDYDDNWGNLHIHLKQGPQILTGQETVGFARFRHDEEGDWGRMKRQQQVINSLISELKKPNNILKIDKFIKIAHENIDTDLTVAEMIDICRFYKDFDRHNMKTGTITGYDAMSEDGQAIIIPNETEKIKLIKKLLLRNDEPNLNKGKIAILNGSYTEGLASELADYLEDKNYGISRIGDADRYDYEESVIIPHNPEAYSLKELSEALGYVRIAPQEISQSGEDFTIIIGNKWPEWKTSRSDLFPVSTERYKEYPGVIKYNPAENNYPINARQNQNNVDNENNDKNNDNDELIKNENSNDTQTTKNPEFPDDAEQANPNQPEHIFKAIPIPKNTEYQNAPIDITSEEETNESKEYTENNAQIYPKDNTQTHPEPPRQSESLRNEESVQTDSPNDTNYADPETYTEEHISPNEREDLKEENMINEEHM